MKREHLRFLYKHLNKIEELKTMTAPKGPEVEVMNFLIDLINKEIRKVESERSKNAD